MINANLENCINCGHIVSKNANTCPDCGTHDFTGTSCVFCNKTSRESNLLKLNSQYKLSEPENIFVHKKCIHQLLNINQLNNKEFKCKDCGISLKNSEIKKILLDDHRSLHYHSFDCFNCGSTVPLNNTIESCYFCGYTILKSYHQFNKLKIKTNDYYKKTIKKVYLHTGCVNNIDTSMIIHDSFLQKILSLF